jgi:hypothetical protein
MRLHLAFLIMILCIPRIALPDYLKTDAKTIYGQVLRLDSTHITFSADCKEDEAVKFSWSDVTEVNFTSECKSGVKHANKTSHKIEPCIESHDKYKAFGIKLREQATPVAALNMVLEKNQRIHMSTYNPKEYVHGDASAVESIFPMYVCNASIEAENKYPESFCHEPVQYAVDFDYDSQLNNKILTNGFSFVIKSFGSAPQDFDKNGFGVEIKNAFQSALLLWTSGLAEKSSHLPQSVQKFIKSKQSSGGGYTVLVPPQVVQLQCKDNATFVIQLHFSEDDFFPHFPAVLARAEIEGRTIGLNMYRFPCFRSELKFNKNKNLSFLLSDGCINLVPIITHELGHAFGLQHLNQPGFASLMDSKFDKLALIPTERDIAYLSEILEKSIIGAIPGQLSFVSSAGVEPPNGWELEAQVQRSILHH